MIIVFQTIQLLFFPASASFAMLSLAVLSVATFGSPAPSPWTKVLLTDAVARGAVCLDGSPGGYYIKFPPNQDNLNKKWVRTPPPGRSPVLPCLAGTVFSLSAVAARLRSCSQNYDLSAVAAALRLQIIFHEGGGWCNGDGNCADRATTPLGTSTAWGDQPGQ